MAKITLRTPLFPEEVTERCKAAIVVDGTEFAQRIADRLVAQMGAGSHRYANDTARYVAELLGIVPELLDVERAIRRLRQRLQFPSNVKICRPRVAQRSPNFGEIQDDPVGTPPPGDYATEPRGGWAVDWQNYPVEDIADHGPVTYNKIELLRQAGLHTIGQLNDFRNDREAGGLLRITGIGEATAKIIGDALNEWLKLHRDYPEMSPNNARLPEDEVLREEDLGMIERIIGRGE